jgi:type IV pilus assembly protein PilW
VPTATCGNNEMIEGIENMQILYGVYVPPLQGVSEYFYYVPADKVVQTGASSGDIDWDNVVAVKISLLATSMDDNVTLESLPYTYNGATTTPTDKRMRRVYNSSMTLRNRIN